MFYSFSDDVLMWMNLMCMKSDRFSSSFIVMCVCVLLFLHFHVLVYVGYLCRLW